MTKSTEPMSNVDTAWLQMDRPVNMMMIAAFMTFDGPVDFDRVIATIERRLLTFDRFRQRIVPPRLPFGNYTWKFDPHFDIRAHVHRIALPAPGDKSALQELMSDIISTPLDRSRPLWQFHIVEGYNDGWVLAGRLHHAIADGIALMRVLLSLTDFSADAPLPPTDSDDVRAPGKQRGLIQAITSPATSLVRTTFNVADTVLRQSLETFRNPGRIIDLAKIGTDNATTLAKMALRTPDPQTKLRGPLGITKRAVWSDPLDLAEVKSIGRALRGTVNDVLTAAITGALRRYLLDHEQAVDGLNIRALVPVNLRPLDEPLELGNRFGLIFPTLPIGVADPYERFLATHRNMTEIKNSPEAVVAYGVLYALGMTPVDIESIFLDFFGSKSSLVLTNVPGPQLQLYLAGSPLREVMAWVPQSGGLGMGISIISYNGGVMVGVTTDTGLISDPEQIIENLSIEFDTLRQLAANTARQNATD
ncbi:MAG: wax ester/triacylglycerol synthase family O-acyltransferase [Anaerolineae bacterium]|nr:wax ester/triacylglycerol synthase family O-acyltransferase [Anaerolineae bacterium]